MLKLIDQRGIAIFIQIKVENHDLNKAFKRPSKYSLIHFYKRFQRNAQWTPLDERENKGRDMTIVNPRAKTEPPHRKTSFYDMTSKDFNSDYIKRGIVRDVSNTHFSINIRVVLQSKIRLYHPLLFTRVSTHIMMHFDINQSSMEAFHTSRWLSEGKFCFPLITVGKV